MPSATLTPRAEEDVREIWRYTEETWSEDQAQIYVDNLFDAMDALAATPTLGRSTEDLGEGLRRQNCGSHVIFYLYTAEGILVVRVLHQRMDFQAHLANDET